MKGEIIYSYFYDFADRINLADIKNYLRGAEEFTFYDYGKSVPEGLNPFELPIVVNTPKKDIVIDDISIKPSVQCVIYSVGAMALRVRVPLEDATTDLISRLTFDKRFEGKFKIIADETKLKVEKSLSKHINVKEKKIFEMYRQYFIEKPSKDFAEKNRKWIAGILLDDQKYQDLSNEYVNSTLKRSISYYNSDLLLVDWDAMLMLSNFDKYENEVTVVDAANIQLLEYRVYQEEIDRMIDLVNKRFVGIRDNPLGILFTRSSLLKLSKDISDFYADYKDLIDSINNIIMSFGEWYLAKVYSILSDSFRLNDLEKRLQSTFDMLVNIRNFIQEHVSEETSSFLEWIVIILFVLEIILIVIPVLKP